MTTIYECAFCDNKTSNVSDWGIDFENEYDDRYCGDCFSEYYDVCGVCDEYILKEELLDMTDEEGDEYLCCENCEREIAIKLNDPQKIDSFSKKIDLNKTKETDCINNEMNTEMMNEIALMSAEDKNVAVAPVAPVVKKEKKPKKECCSCNEMFKDRDLCGDAYGDIWCYDCYDDEYILCFQCNEEIPREKYGDEYWERDGDCYCEGCRDEYDEDQLREEERQEEIDCLKEEEELQKEELQKKALEGKVSV